MEFSEYQKLVWRYGDKLAMRALDWWQRQSASTRAMIPTKKQAQYCIDNESSWRVRF